MLWSPSGGQTRPENVGKAIVGTADGLASGVVKGIGGIFGIPDTDAAKCDAAIAANDGGEAGKFCSAWRLAAAIPGSFVQSLQGVLSPTRPSAPAAYTTTKPAGQASPSPTGGLRPDGIVCVAGVCGGSFESMSQPNLFDVQGWIEQKNTVTPVAVAGIRG